MPPYYAVGKGNKPHTKKFCLNLVPSIPLSHARVSGPLEAVGALGSGPWGLAGRVPPHFPSPAMGGGDTGGRASSGPRSLTGTVTSPPDRAHIYLKKRLVYLNDFSTAPD